MKSNRRLFTKEESEKIAKEYYNGNTDKVVEEVWKKTDQQIRKGVIEGYGTTGYDVKDFDTVSQLSNNIGVFSAFKSYRVNGEMKANLVDEKGNKRSFNEFLEEYRKVDNEYNINYLRSEYNIAQKQAASANQWQDFERDKNLYPNLKYMASRSANPRESHMQYYGKIKPIDDPIWDTLTPPLDWGCNCWVTNTDEPAEATSIEAPLPIDGVAGNAGRSGEVFNKNHPYVREANKTEKKKVENFYNHMRDEHLNDEYVSSKVGKGRVKLSLNANKVTKKEHLEFAYNTTSDHGKTFEVLSKKDVPFRYNKTKGDLSKIDQKNLFDKYEKGKSLNQMKTSFLGIELGGKLSGKNLTAISKNISKGFENNEACKFVIVRNGTKTTIIKRDVQMEEIKTQLSKELM